jgi:hypothetical protein
MIAICETRVWVSNSMERGVRGIHIPELHACIDLANSMSMSMSDVSVSHRVSTAVTLLSLAHSPVGHQAVERVLRAAPPTAGLACQERTQ